MSPWRFLEYESDSGFNPFQDWYLRQDLEVKASLDLTVYQRRVTEDWVNPPSRHARKQFKILDKEHFGLAELRFWTNGKRTFRVAGLYQPSERQFVLFGGCEKLMGGQIYVPEDAFDLALKCKNALMKGRGKLIDHA